MLSLYILGHVEIDHLLLTDLQQRLKSGLLFSQSKAFELSNYTVLCS